METNKQIEKVKALAGAIKALLPKYSEADLTLRVESKDEVIAIAKKITATGKHCNPSEHLPYHWCMYQDGPVKITVQTHEEETRNTKTEHKIHSN